MFLYRLINRKLPEGRRDVTSWPELELFSRAADAISLPNDAAYMVIVVTNQQSPQFQTHQVLEK